MKSLRYLLVILVFSVTNHLTHSQDHNWEAINNGIDNGSIEMIIVNPLDNFVYAATGGGVLRSTDNGENWSLVFSILVTPKGKIMIGTFGPGVFRSDDNGETWKAVNNGITSPYPNFFSIFSLAYDPNGDILAGSSKGRIFRTSNEGEKWVRVDNDFSDYKGEFFDVRSLVVNSKGDYFASLSCGVFHSADKGATWERIGEWSWPLVINSLDYFFTAAPLKQVNKINGKWIQIKSCSNISSLAVDSKDYLFIGTEGNGIFRSRQSTAKLFH